MFMDFGADFFSSPALFFSLLFVSHLAVPGPAFLHAFTRMLLRVSWMVGTTPRGNRSRHLIALPVVAVGFN